MRRSDPTPLRRGSARNAAAAPDCTFQSSGPPSEMSVDAPSRGRNDAATSSTAARAVASRSARPDLTIAPGNGVVAPGRRRCHKRSPTRFSVSHARSAANRSAKARGATAPKTRSARSTTAPTRRVAPAPSSRVIVSSASTSRTTRWMSISCASCRAAGQCVMHPEVDERIGGVEGRHVDVSDAQSNRPIEQHLRPQVKVAPKARQSDQAPVEIDDGVPIVEGHFAHAEPAKPVPVAIAVLEAGTA